MALSYQMEERTYKRAVALLFPRNFLQGRGPQPSTRTMITFRRALDPHLARSPDEELPALPIWAFTLGVFALLTFGLTALPSIVCGHLALARARKTERGSLTKSVALVSLVIGYVGVAVLVTWLVLTVRYLAAA
jgi:hypothetical protein